MKTAALPGTPKSAGVGSAIRTLMDTAYHRRGLAFRVVLYFLMLVISFVFIFPFLYMLVTSIKSYGDLMDISVNWIPREFRLENYAIAASYLGLWSHFLNSLLITGLSSLGHVLVCSLVAYGFSRFAFRGRTLLFMLVIFSILIPPQVMILPQYINFARLGWINSSLPIIVPTFFGYGLRGGLYIFIFRQFFNGLPLSLEDAAQVDGYGFFPTFVRIVLPISLSPILVGTVLSVVWHWNDYYEPAIYISKIERLPLPSMLPAVLNGLRDYHLAVLTNQLDRLVTDGVIMAAITICILPVFLFYIVAQKGFITGIERTGIVE